MASAPVQAVVVNDGMIGAETIDEVALRLGMLARFSGIGGVFASTGATGTLCTGSLVSSTMVLTAAHCFDKNADGTSDYAASQIKFLYGNELGSNLFDPTAPSIVASAVHINPLFVYDGTSTFQIYDLALLALSSAVPADYKPFSVYASPGGNVAEVVGYGGSGTGGATYDNKKRAGQNAAYILGTLPDYTLIDFDRLNTADPGGDYRDGKPVYSLAEALPCEGDSGGPLLTMGEFALSGVLSGPVNAAGAACTYGGAGRYVRTGVEGNSDFLHDHGIKVIDEPATASLLAVALLGLVAALTRRSSA